MKTKQEIIVAYKALSAKAKLDFLYGCAMHTPDSLVIFPTKDDVDPEFVQFVCGNGNNGNLPNPQDCLDAIRDVVLR